MCCLLVTDEEEATLLKDEDEGTRTSVPTQLMKLKRSQWWILVFISICFLIFAQSIAVLLGRFYYNEGGNSKWISTLVQTGGFPILYIPLYLLLTPHSSSSSSSCSFKTLFWILSLSWPCYWFRQSFIFFLSFISLCFNLFTSMCFTVSFQWCFLLLHQFSDNHFFYFLVCVTSLCFCCIDSFG